MRPLARFKGQGLKWLDMRTRVAGFKGGCHPHRVFFMNIPEDSIKERLTLRRVDPKTGERSANTTQEGLDALLVGGD